FNLSRLMLIMDEIPTHKHSKKKHRVILADLVPFSLQTKFWIKGPGDLTLGKGDFKLLEALAETHNLTDAVKKLNYSYKYGWEKLRKISKKTGKKVAISSKGGSGGGGKVELTQWGQNLLDLYQLVKKDVENFLEKENEKIAKSTFIAELPPKDKG
ncbi:MAG: winged helix-turn-helix domain-containing protein, partial [Promethearchaeota archaeon]